MLKISARVLLASLSAAGTLSACGGGGGSSSSTTGTGQDFVAPPTLQCATPMQPMAVDLSVTDNVPSDFDSTATPTPTPTTTIDFTVLLPPRCPGDHFPLVLQSHGYSGTRIKTLGPNGDLEPTQAHFDSINALVRALPYHGYVVISYDERGHGAPLGQQAQHNARAIDPAAETQDAIAILDWAYDNADDYAILREPNTGTAKDVRVGTIGYSYGGGFEMPLALLDKRVDTIVPNGTWNNLLYSLLPGDSVKLGFDSLLCTLAIQGNVNNTPLLATLCSLIGPAGQTAVTLRTRDDLSAAATSYTGLSRAARDSDELLNFFYTHGTSYFEHQDRDGKAINPLDRPGVTASNPTGLALPSGRRQIPALFVQGNRDTLFNLTDAYFNYRYFKSVGADVRLLTTEGGHMNPLALQSEGSANCGGVVGVQAMLAWFDDKLKGADSPTYDAIPQVCISVTDTPAANAAPANANLVGLLVDDIPVGSLSGPGAIPAQAATLTASVTPGVALPGGMSTPVFVKIADITQANAVLAGIPRAQSISVTAGTGALVTPVAYVGVGIMRGGTTILVDDQVTPFAALAPDTGSTGAACPPALSLPATAHCNNRGTGDNTVLLPGVGEQLQAGDQVGLLFYENQVQYLPANTAGSGGLPNPYNVGMTHVELPILIPGSYRNSRLSRPKP